MQQQEFNTIEELLPRYAEGSVTSEERETVEEWLNASGENRKLAKQVFAIYLATDTLDTLKTVDTEKALIKVKGRIKGKKRVTWWKWTQRVAAVLFIPLAVAWTVYYFNTEEQMIGMMEVRTNPGMTTSVVLPDSSVVFLNSESTLRYPSRFGKKERLVTLNGEGFFTVTKDVQKKFIVQTSGQSQIEVLGTTFNVEAYEDEGEISTTLLEGKVAFNYQAENQFKRVVLEPNQKLVYDIKTGKANLYATNCQTEMAWKDGKVVFNNTPLEEALRILEKRFDVEFVLKNKHLKENSFTGTFTKQRLERILEYFRISSGVKWRYIDNSDILDTQTQIEIY